MSNTITVDDLLEIEARAEGLRAKAIKLKMESAEKKHGNGVTPERAAQLKAHRLKTIIKQKRSVP